MAISVVTASMILTGSCLADQWDFNPGQTAVKYQYEQQEGVEGVGYVRQYQDVVTNSLPVNEYMHGSFKEASSMVHQIEYARGYAGDITVDLNCTGSTFLNKGVGLTRMKIKGQVIDGTVHIRDFC
jgi:hypothetical protein